MIMKVAMTPEQMELKRLRAENRDMKHYLRNLATVVCQTIATLDTEMAKHESPKRGEVLAAACNTLEYANDSMICFGLKVDFRQMEKIKKQWTGVKGATAAQRALRLNVPARDAETANER